MKEIKFSRTIVYFLPFFLWVALIFHLSSQPYQKQTILPFLRQHFNENAVSKALPDITIHYHTSVIPAKQKPFQFIEFIFRKCAHLFVYGMFAVTVYIALVPFRLRLFFGFAASLATVTCIALLDEWNQKSIQRTSTIEDVAVDVTGGAICLIIGIAIYRCFILLNHLRNRQSTDITKQ
ncbi:VanZ family protein [Paenibacillus montanisoli]|uniref:VanZ family protein n=1 Tax=Paenibacillus montanisoli TaxID=2081970 RepID=A0A328U7W5_9BACL|nr:VanZ family protein [Paenibacillus montanisoli]RAP77491.1 VanZ family protein [Paenibacillus montanisoli]